MRKTDQCKRSLRVNIFVVLQKIGIIRDPISGTARGCSRQTFVRSPTRRRVSQSFYNQILH